MMTDKQQQAAAALFAEEWKGKLGGASEIFK